MNLKTWIIPAKTFLLGEYAALAGAPALVVTTQPCFEVGLLPSTSKAGESFCTRQFKTTGIPEAPTNLISPASPAGRWWRLRHFKQYDLICSDPYQGIGGFGASSAQFIAAFLARCHIEGTVPTLESMLSTYLQMSAANEGVTPSGYDVIAQTQNKCVFIHRQAHGLETSPWPFKEIGFLLLHTGKKLATHDHLRSQPIKLDVAPLAAIVKTAWQAFQTHDSALFIHAVNDYQRALIEQDLMAQHSRTALADLQTRFGLLATKGCGAMGADVLLLIIESEQLKTLKETLLEDGWQVMASHQDLYNHPSIFQNNSKKKLEILS